jgi:CDP-glucose 4,6-dehydratase
MEGLVLMSNPDINFWKNKKVLVTGHTGFKGAWLSFWLHELGAKVIGISLPPTGSKNLYRLLELKNKINSHYHDIRDFQGLNAIVVNEKPEVVFHLAAQPLVRASYKNPLFTYSTNIIGCANLLESIRQFDFTKAVIIITTDKVYSNNEWEWPYRENDTLGGYDPYSASKAAAELVVDSYRKSYLEASGISLSSARAGNVIGGGDWSEDRLIPDLMNAYEKESLIEIRNPNSIRPWQHVLEPLLGYILIAEKTYNNLDLAMAYNIGPETSEARSVLDVAKNIEKLVDKKLITILNPINSTQNLHEAGILKLDCSLSKRLIGIKPRWRTDQAVKKSIKWYMGQIANRNVEDLCREDIYSYTS